MKNVAAISVNKGCCSHQATTAVPTVSLEGTQDGDKWAAGCQAPSHCSHPPVVYPEGTQAGEKQDTGPRQLRCISKGYFQ